MLVLELKIQSNIIQSNAFLVSHFSQFMEPVAGSQSYWKPCYRASTDGWAASTFHHRCDGKRNTVTIIRKDQYVFGGYTDIPWGMVNPIQPAGGGGGGGVPALTLNVYNFFKIQPNAAKLYEFF